MKSRNYETLLNEMIKVGQVKLEGTRMETARPKATVMKCMTFRYIIHHGETAKMVSLRPFAMALDQSHYDAASKLDFLWVEKDVQ